MSEAVNRGTEADPIWIMPCCGGHEVCYDHCITQEVDEWYQS